jgi:hypothetical protein
MFSLSSEFFRVANLFEILIWCCFLTSSSFSFLRLNLSTSNFCAAYLLTASLSQIIFKNFVPTLQRVHYVSIISNSNILLSGEVIIVYCENHTKYIQIHTNLIIIIVVDLLWCPCNVSHFREFPCVFTN